jgi:hypothetical protein
MHNAPHEDVFLPQVLVFSVYHLVALVLTLRLHPCSSCGNYPQNIDMFEGNIKCISVFM